MNKYMTIYKFSSVRAFSFIDVLNPAKRLCNAFGVAVIVLVGFSTR